MVERKNIEAEGKGTSKRNEKEVRQDGGKEKHRSRLKEENIEIEGTKGTSK